MSELIESLKRASAGRGAGSAFQTRPLDKPHALAYAAATALFLLGIMMGFVVYLRRNAPVAAFACAMPFVLAAAPLFCYFGLTQETKRHYGMRPRRALAYSGAAEALLAGVALAGVSYLRGHDLVNACSAPLPFVTIAAIGFVYLGLTERSRRKMGPEWEKQWVEYYRNPQTMILRGTLSAPCGSSRRPPSS